MLVRSSFELTTDLPSAEVVRRVEALLAAEGVTSESHVEGVASTRMPFVVFGFQRRLYSRRNWTGLNPFAFADAVAVECKATGDGTKVLLSVDRTRAVLATAFGLIVLSAGAVEAPAVVRGVLGVMAIALVWLRWSWLGGRLIAVEVRSALATPASAA